MVSDLSPKVPTPIEICAEPLNSFLLIYGWGYYVVTLSAPQHVNVFGPLHFFELATDATGYLGRMLFVYFTIMLRIQIHNFSRDCYVVQ